MVWKLCQEVRAGSDWNEGRGQQDSRGCAAAGNGTGAVKKSYIKKRMQWNLEELQNKEHNCTTIVHVGWLTWEVASGNARAWDYIRGALHGH